MDRFDISLFFELFPKILKFLPETLKLAVVTIFCSLILALLVAIIRQYKIKGLYSITSVYVSFFRGTPFVAQLFWFYYGLAQVSSTIKSLNQFQALVICMSLN